jgi:hypothetical protein
MAATAVQAPVDTSKTSGRREIRYRNHDEVLADAERLAATGYRQLGNWSLGQVAQHLAKAMTTALDGWKELPAWPIRVLARLLFKDKAVRGPMQPGFKLPPKVAPFLLPDAATDATGIDALRTAVRRWKAEPQRHPHGFFGKLTPEEWEKLMLNHAAMHMSFLVPQQQ